jgi:hypothetical protein
MYEDGHLGHSLALVQWTIDPAKSDDENEHHNFTKVYARHPIHGHTNFRKLSTLVV